MIDKTMLNISTQDGSRLPDTLAPRLVMLLLVLFKLWLVAPHEVVMASAPHDDLLFVVLASNILNGDWLGEYNQLTLVRGAIYPLFIALANLLAIPIMTAQQLFYAAACLALVAALRSHVRGHWWLVAIFAYLLFNPGSYNYAAVGRLFRESVCASLVLFVFACLWGMSSRLRMGYGRPLLWAAGLGLSLAAFWNIREEGVWIVPSLALVMLPLLWTTLRSGTTGKQRTVLAVVLPLMIFASVELTIRAMNWRYYGIFETVELKSPEFKAAYGGLLRIEAPDWKRYRPVSAQAREMAARVSPSYREIAPFLTQAVADFWQGIFVYPFRDAVASAGYYKDGASTLDYYRRLGAEIKQACETGQLKCGPPISGLMPAWHREYNSLVAPTFYDVLRRMTGLRGEFTASREEIYSEQSHKLTHLYSAVTNSVLRFDDPALDRAMPPFHQRMTGWKVDAMTVIYKNYRRVSRFLSVIALLVLVWAGVRQIGRRSLDEVTVFSAALFTGILSLTMILALFQITAWLAIDRQLHVIFPVVLLFNVFGILQLVVHVRGEKVLADGLQQHPAPDVTV